MKSIRGMLSRTNYRIVSAILVLGIFGGVLLVQAATSNIKFEAESGSLSGQVATAADSTASNGQYVGFNAATPPPSGTQFFEGFDSDTRSRFDWQLQTTSEPPQGDFLGDHNGNTPCGNPYTYRTVHQIPLAWGVWHTKVDATNSEMIWWCAPGDDTAKGHMMTALNTASIASLNFSPKQIMNNVKKVCWDVNMTNLGEGKWLNMFVVPNSSFVAGGSDLAYEAVSGAPFGGIPQKLPDGAVDFTWLRGSIASDKFGPNGTYTSGLDVWMSLDPTDTNGDGVVNQNDRPTKGMATDPAPRFTICVDDGGNKVTIERPDGSFDTYPYNIAFPTGQVRVIFQDASYNPVKHNGSDTHLTWHWDNILIE